MDVGDSLVCQYNSLSSLSRYISALRGCLRTKLKLVRRVERAREGLWQEYARRRRVYWGDMSELVLERKAASMTFLPSNRFLPSASSSSSSSKKRKKEGGKGKAKRKQGGGEREGEGQRGKGKKEEEKG